MKIAVIIGTRPEIIKMSPVIRALDSRKADYFILHTGQHYSFELDRVFLKQLKLPEPSYNLAVGSGSDAEQTANILTGIEAVLLKEKPDVVLVEGDTNSVLAGSLAAAKLHIPVGHIEAGLRSYDKQMPEEINRVLADHCSDYLFAPTQRSKDILLKEGISEEKVYVTGNTIVDAVKQNIKIAFGNNNGGSALSKIPRDFYLATIHRRENVDNYGRFASILNGLDTLANETSIPIIYPVHPHSLKKMREYELQPKNIILIDPVDYLSFLKLEHGAQLILTDSGGVQEEACILRVPCVTLRDNTERPETVEVGSNVIAGVETVNILKNARIMLARETDWANPFGDGKAAIKIVDILLGG
jgi:UDP-N-acetylglucosamine 2-epimerase (non-hydrolysing)